MSLEGKSVIVVGAGAGMGEATALKYGRRGAEVLVTDVNGAAATAVAEAIRDDGGTAEPYEFDLRDRGQVADMVEAAVSHFGGLDVLAIVGAIYQNRTVGEMEEEFWDNMFQVDLKGPLYAIQAALPHMRESGGAIVTVTTGAAFYPIVGLSAYGAAKAGLVALGRVLALEENPKIRVNTVVPGPTMTEGVRTRPEPTKAVAETRQKNDYRSQLSSFRWLEPEEIADVIVWVSSDEASAVNGAIFRVDAGHYML